MYINNIYYMLAIFYSFASSFVSTFVSKVIEENILSTLDLVIFAGGIVFGFFAYRIHMIVQNVKKIK